MLRPTARALLRRAALIGAVSALALPLAAVGAAAAPGGPSTGGGSTGSGYSVSVSVVFSGDAAPGGGSTASVSIPAKCWWVPFGQTQLGDVDSSDPEAVRRYIEEEVLPFLRGHAAAGSLAIPPAEVFEAAVQAAIAGEQVTWYSVRCRDGVSALDEGYHAGIGGTYMGITVPITMAWFTPGNPPPAPLVDPEDLAIAARDAMVIEAPEIDRNPKAPSLGAATLVRLPTWFWVTNGEAALGGDGTKTIRAEVQGSAVPTWAEVTAETDGLALQSDAGSTACGAAAALTPWSPGADGGCTVAFSRASTPYPAGWPVQASTQWTATWVGSGGTGGALDPLTRAVVVDVPVAESQAIVTRGR